MEAYWIWFSMLKISDRQKLMLLENNSPETLFHRDPEDPGLPEQLREALQEKDLTQAERIVQSCKDKAIQIITIRSRAYPPRLRNIAEPPLVLYGRGVVPDWDAAPVVGIVGTRDLSPYGRKTATRMGRQIASCGGIVASGGARGVDAFAMDGALQGDGTVICVLGTGVDVAYPKANKPLFEKVAEKGLILSEYPPGTGSQPWHFPRRNRIISGISNGVLVIEAPEMSGALITAAQAREQGRDVFSVPGSVDTPSCIGSNRLLQEGAFAAMCGWDVMKEYAAVYPAVKKAPGSTDLMEENEAVFVAQKPQIPTSSKKENPDNRKKSIDNEEKSSYSVCVRRPELSQEEELVFRLLTDQVQLMDDLLPRIDLPAGRALSILTKLTMLGVAKSHPGKGISLK